MFIDLKNLIPKTINARGIGKEVSAAHVCHRARKVLTEIFPDKDIEQFVRPLCFKDHTVFLGAKNSAYSYLVHTKKEEILSQLQSGLPDYTIKKIVIRADAAV